jgi:hypothetical protein
LIEAGADARLKDIGIVCVGKGPKRTVDEKGTGPWEPSPFLGPVPKRSVPDFASAI